MQYENKDGSLTRYALACGYIQKIEKGKRSLVLENYASTSVFCVTLYARDLDACPLQMFVPRMFQSNFETLTEAKKVYNSLKKFVKG